MRRYGVEPPWAGRDSSLGWWKNVGELWEGGYAWDLQPPRTTSQKLHDVLISAYVTPIKEMLNSDSPLLLAMNRELDGLRA